MAMVDPVIGDVHRVGSFDGLAISIHVHGVGLARAGKNFYRAEARRDGRRRLNEAPAERWNPQSNR